MFVELCYLVSWRLTEHLFYVRHFRKYFSRPQAGDRNSGVCAEFRLFINWCSTIQCTPHCSLRINFANLHCYFPAPKQWLLLERNHCLPAQSSPRANPPYPAPAAAQNTHMGAQHPNPPPPPQQQQPQPLQQGLHPLAEARRNLKWRAMPLTSRIYPPSNEWTMECGFRVSQ